MNLLKKMEKFRIDLPSTTPKILFYKLPEDNTEAIHLAKVVKKQ